MFYDTFIKSKILYLKKNMIKTKKYWIIYILLISIFTISNITLTNLVHPKMEILMFLLISVIGIFLIIFFEGHKEDKNIHKNVFLIILIFGIICSFLTPTMLIPDEQEHFVRAEITSQGIIFPEYSNGTFFTIQSSLDLITDSNTDNSTVFNINADNMPINYSSTTYPHAFAQNPFYGYIFPALGMFIAKLFDLNSIWLLWLGRIFNVLLYSSLVTVAVKKTPILKVPMITFSCIPLAIFLCASTSIDSLINGLGILSISYFFYMYKSSNLDKINIIKFSILVIILGTCKLTFFAFILLLLLIPKENFNNAKEYNYIFISILILGILAIAWSKFYANPGMLTSSPRMEYWIENNVNSSEQITYIFNHKKDFLLSIFQMPKYLINDFLKITSFSNELNVISGSSNYIYLLFLGAICLLYPKPIEPMKTRVGTLLLCSIIYIGTYLTLLITWTPVGQLNEILGIQPRYFLPLLILLPFIFGINNNENNTSKIDSYIIMITLVFLSGLILKRVLISY